MSLDAVEENLTGLIGRAAQETLGAAGEQRQEKVSLDIPDNPAYGDFSTNIALRLSRILKRPPRDVGQELAAVITKMKDASSLASAIDKVEVAGPGFINFFICRDYYFRQIEEILARGDEFGREDIGGGQKAQIEFVSANPTGPLSIAHARQAAVGDSLARIMDFCGFDVTREYYLNDKGRQIEILGKSVELRFRQLQGEDLDFPGEYYQGDYIREIAAGLKGQEIKTGGLARYSLNLILERIKKDLADFGVSFDVFFSQEGLEAEGAVEQVIERLRAGGFIEDREGACWFKSSVLGDDKDRVIVKSDGRYTYLAPDIAYHQDKFRRGFHRIINIWGPDHHGYIPRIKAAVSALGQDREALSVIIVQLVRLLRRGKAVPMSTRRGSYVTLRQLIDEVGRDATRFFLVARRASSHLDFDLELAKEQSAENPVYYIQYAFARICSIMRRQKEQAAAWPRAGQLSLLDKPQETALIRKLVGFPRLLRTCLNSLDPYPLTSYLQDLAGSWHKFYDTHKVLDAANPELSRARISLAEACGIVFRNGLSLLGLCAPERM